MASSQSVTAFDADVVPRWNIQDVRHLFEDTLARDIESMISHGNGIGAFQRDDRDFRVPGRQLKHLSRA